jgi:hypothetical protein
MVCGPQAKALVDLVRSHLDSRRSLELLWIAELQGESARIPFVASSFRSSPGELILVSAACYAIAFIFLPAIR